jgi:hypothetical protein
MYILAESFRCEGFNGRGALVLSLALGDMKFVSALSHLPAKCIAFHQSDVKTMQWKRSCKNILEEVRRLVRLHFDSSIHFGETYYAKILCGNGSMMEQRRGSCSMFNNYLFKIQYSWQISVICEIYIHTYVHRYEHQVAIWLDYNNSWPTASTLSKNHLNSVFTQKISLLILSK